MSKLTTKTYNLFEWLCSIYAVFVVTFNTSTQNAYRFSEASCGLFWNLYEYLIKYLDWLLLLAKREAANLNVFFGLKLIQDSSSKCSQLHFTHLLFYTLLTRYDNPCSCGSKLIFNTCTCLQKNVPSASTPGRISCRSRPDQLMSRWRLSTNAAMPSVDTDGETEPFALWTY